MPNAFRGACLTAFVAFLGVVLASSTARADKIYVGGFGVATVQVIDSATNTPVATIALAATATGAGQVTPIPGGSPYIFVPERGNGTVAVIDSRTMQIFTRFAVSVPDPFQTAVTPDGKWLFVVNFAANPLVCVVNVKGFIEAAAISLAGQGVAGFMTPAMHPSGSTCFLLSNDSGVPSGLHAIRIPAKGNPSLIGAPFPRFLPATVGQQAGFTPQTIGVSANFVYCGDLVTAASDILAIYNIRRGNFTTLPLPAGGGNGTFPISIAVPRNGTRAFVSQPGLTRITVVNTQRNTVMPKFINAAAAGGGPGLAPAWLDARGGIQFAWFTDSAASISRVDLGNLGFPRQDTNLDGISPDPVALGIAPIGTMVGVRPDFPGKGFLPGTDADGSRLAGGFEAPMLDALATVLSPPVPGEDAPREGGAVPVSPPSCLFYGIAAALGCVALTLRQAVLRN